MTDSKQDWMQQDTIKFKDKYIAIVKVKIVLYMSTLTLLDYNTSIQGGSKFTEHCHCSSQFCYHNSESTYVMSQP